MPADARTFIAPDISCNHCKQHIEKALSALEGVDTVNVDPATKTVTVAGDASDDTITSALAGAGYPVG